MEKIKNFTPDNIFVEFGMPKQEYFFPHYDSYFITEKQKNKLSLKEKLCLV